MSRHPIYRTAEQNGLDYYTDECRKMCRDCMAERDPRRQPYAMRQAHVWMYRALNNLANAGLYRMEQRAQGIVWPPARIRFTVGPVFRHRFFRVPQMRRHWYR